MPCDRQSTRGPSSSCFWQRGVLWDPSSGSSSPWASTGSGSMLVTLPTSQLSHHYSMPISPRQPDCFLCLYLIISPLLLWLCLCLVLTKPWMLSCCQHGRLWSQQNQHSCVASRHAQTGGLASSEVSMPVANEGTFLQAGRASKLLVCADLWQDQADQGGFGYETQGQG